MKRLLVLFVCVWGAAAAGCGKDGPVKHTVTGAVELDGVPLTEGDLTFLPKDKNLHPEGARIKDGKYAVAIRPGTYTVKIIGPTKKVPLEPGESSAYGDKEKVVNTVPAHYNEETTLTVEIKDDTPKDFKLTTKKK